MGTRSDSDCATRGVGDGRAACDERGHAGEVGGAVSVGEEDVEAASVAEAVGYCAAFAAVGLKGDHSHDVVKVVFL